MKTLKILLILIFSLFVTDNLPQDAEAATTNFIRRVSSGPRVLERVLTPLTKGDPKFNFVAQVITTSKSPFRFTGSQGPNLLMNFSTTLVSYGVQNRSLVPFVINTNALTSTGAPAITALTSTGVPGITALAPKGAPAITALTSTGAPAITALAPKGAPGITALAPKGAPGITALTSTGVPGITALTSTGAPGITALTSTGVPGITALALKGALAITALTSTGVPNTTALIPYQIHSVAMNSFKAFRDTTSVQGKKTITNRSGVVAPTQGRVLHKVRKASRHWEYSTRQVNGRVGHGYKKKHAFRVMGGVDVFANHYSTYIPHDENIKISGKSQEKLKIQEELKEIFPEASEEEVNKFYTQVTNAKKSLKKTFPKASEKALNKFLIQVLDNIKPLKGAFVSGSIEKFYNFLTQVIKEGLTLKKNNFDSYKQTIEAFLKYVNEHASTLNELWPKDSEIEIVEFFKQIMSDATKLEKLYSDVSREAIGLFATQVAPKIDYLYLFSDKSENLCKNFYKFLLPLQELKMDQEKIEEKTKGLLNLIIDRKSSDSCNAAEFSDS